MSAIDVANYYLSKTVYDEEMLISNSKLQKLLYYTQGFSLALFDIQIFEEDVEAWLSGPVVSDVYETFKGNGINPIQVDQLVGNLDSLFSKEQLDFLDEVYEVFGKYSTWKLQAMIEEEPIWIAHRDNISVITKKEMREYFKTRV